MSDNPQDKQLAMIAHLLGILTGWLGPLILWIVKKEQGGFVAAEAKKALNFQITVFIAYIVIYALVFVLAMVIGALASFIALLVLVLWVASIIFSIKAGLAANKGEAGSYPFSLNLIK